MYTNIAKVIFGSIRVEEIQIARLIFLIRGQRVMLDSDLANLYQVETGQLNRAVKRNTDRFPSDFMFQLSDQEFASLKCQSGISRSWGGRRTSPNVFTEQGVAMLSSVLRSKEAALVNVQVMPAFIRMRGLIAGHEELSAKIELLEYKIGKHDQELMSLFESIKRLMALPDTKNKKKIGFGR